MKVQIQSQSVRLRIDENELAELLAGQWVTSRTDLGALGGFSCALQLHAGEQARLDGSVTALRFALPQEDVLALQQRLPCRDGLSYELPCNRNRCIFSLMSMYVTACASVACSAVQATSASPQIDICQVGAVMAPLVDQDQYRPQGRRA